MKQLLKYEIAVETFINSNHGKKRETQNKFQAEQLFYSSFYYSSYAGMHHFVRKCKHHFCFSIEIIMFLIFTDIVVRVCFVVFLLSLYLVICKPLPKEKAKIKQKKVYFNTLTLEPMKICFHV